MSYNEKSNHITMIKNTQSHKKMASWHSINLGDAIMAATPSAEIEESFLASFNAAGKPSNMAVFTRAESEGRLHCEVIAYFSPAAQAVAKAFDAEPCEKPARAGLGLLSGDSSCWSVLFPELDTAVNQSEKNSLNKDYT